MRRGGGEEGWGCGGVDKACWTGSGLGACTGRRDRNVVAHLHANFDPGKRQDQICLQAVETSVLRCHSPERLRTRL